MIGEIFIATVLLGQFQMDQQQMQGLTSPGLNPQAVAATTPVPPSLMIMENVIRRSLPQFDRPIRKTRSDKKRRTW
jgi:hypothetical protein